MPNDLDGIHMHDTTGEILGGAEMIRFLKAMEGDVTFTDDDVAEGDTARLIIPRGWGPRRAIVTIFSQWYNLQQPTTFKHTFRYRPYDGARAADCVLRRTFGVVDGKPTESFFGTIDPQMVTVQTGIGTTEQVPWGELHVAAFDGAVVTFSATEDGDFGTVFHMEVTVPRRSKETVEMVFADIEMELAENSIYKSKIIMVGEGDEPRFVDLSGVDVSTVIYTADVERALQANLWGPMRQTDKFRRLGLPIKQAVLAYGLFGTGKSLAGLRSALIAVENGWTAILCESADSLEQALELAAMYGRAFVFCEDIDSIAAADCANIERVLEMFDGVVNKGTETLLLATTNKVGSLHAGVMRPGRLDVLVEVGMVDAASIKRMILAQVKDGSLDSAINFDEVVAAMAGFTPAFVVQATQRALKYRVLDGVAQLGTSHLVDAAAELQEQLKLMEAAGTTPQRPPLDAALADVVSAQVAATVSEFRVAGRSGGQLVRDPSNNGTKG